jgi:alpha-tubulin suppressor-like RCC1 family protein/subtilisin-like proprotein convertase family protein
MTNDYRMRRHRLTWFIVLLLCAAGVAFLLFLKGINRNTNNSAGKNTVAAGQSSASHSASTNAVKAAAASAKTNKFAWRLTNTDKPFSDLIHDPHAILLDNAFIDTSAKFTLSIPKNLQSKGDPGAYVVQARGPITAAFRAMLAANGATIISYIPNDAYLVRATESVADNLMENALVQAVIAYEPYYKVQSPLLAMADQPMPADKQLSLALFPDIAQQTLQQIQQMGGILVAEEDSAAGYPVVRVQPPADWTQVAQLPGVHIVEPFYRRHLANDLARETLNISSNSITQSDYMNLYGSNVVVDLNDGGVDTNHPDFSNGGVNTPRVFGFGTNNPDDGHGTHVAGIIAGDGFESTTVTNAPGSILPATNGQFRGKAPFAQVLSMNFQDDDQTLQQTAATNGALISNNSWDFPGDFQYDLEAASYDAATRDALPFVPGPQPVLFVFSAGNDGNGGTPDTVDSPATAKDVMSVGALEELRDITNQVTNAVGQSSMPWQGETIDSNAVPGFSSIGNTEIGIEGTFGRFKPDVVAPGTFVVSTRSSAWDALAYYNPTNDTISDFPDFLPPDSVSVAPFNFFVPSNAVEVVFQTVTNIGSPLTGLPSMPIYLSTNNSPYGFIGTNFVTMAPGVSVNEDWAVEVSNVTTAPLSYDLIVDVLTTNNAGNYFIVLSNLNQSIGTGDANGNPFYRYETGTSMAAGSISGFLALIQDFFTNQYGLGWTPSPALLKAMTINGSRSSSEYNFGVDNTTGNFQGWGLPSLINSVPSGLTNIPLPGNLNTAGPECSTFFRDQGPTNALATGDYETFTVHLNTNNFDSFENWRVTLAWTDPPGDPSADIKLVNSLELVVTDLDNPSIVFYGNDIAPGDTFNTPESATNEPVIDSINNIQNIYMEPVGTNLFPDADFSVTVIGNRVNVNAVPENTNDDVQDFAIVMSVGDLPVTNAMTVTDGGILSEATGSALNITIGETNTILLDQIAGANTPLIDTNFVNMGGNTDGIGTNSQFEIGMTNQWHFYIVTNTTTFTNAAFITFGATTLSVPREGVLANSDENATVPDPDLDMMVTRGSTDPNAAFLTNLWPQEISNCVDNLQGDGASLAPGGTDFVVYTNAQPGEVFYIGVKSESHMAVEYGFVPIFTQTPFGSQDTNGNVTINGLNLPVAIPDGTPSKPGVARVFMININPIQIQDVVVTNVISHQNFGDLVGSLTHNGTTVVLNNHDSLTTPAPPGPYELIYDDSGQGDVPDSRTSDGPGSLRSFENTSGQGVWLLTEEGTALAQTGEVQDVSIFLQKHQDLTGSGVTAVVQPGEWFYDFVDVPNGITNLTIFGTNLSQTVDTPPLQMFLLDGAPPTMNNFDFEVLLTNGVPPGNEISDGPPLASGIYWVGIFNPSLAPQTVFLLAVLNGPSSVEQPQPFTTTNASPITVDAVTNNTILVSDTNGTISSVNVGFVVQYPRISDLAFTLISPSGQRVLLMENRGGPSATNAGGVFFITNSFAPVNASGSFEPNTNYVNVGANEGSVTISYNMFTIPDEMTVYYGTNSSTFTTPALGGALLFDSGLVSGQSNVTVTFGPGDSTYLTIIMNQFGNTNTGGSDAWTYNINGTIPVFNYLTFTDDTNLTDVPIKFAIPPFDFADEGTNFILSDLSLATNKDYFGQTNIYDAFGGWYVPSNQVTEVVSNTIVITNANYNEVSVVSNPAVAFTGTNYLALAYGTILRTNQVDPFHMYTFSYAYRGPGIAGWWRGEGDARDSSDAEQHGQNGALIGRFDFPAGEVSQAFEMENNGGAYDFAGTNSYVQIRQQPIYAFVNTNNSVGEGGTNTLSQIQTSYLDVGTGSGLTVEGWINPTNVTWQEPLVEWLARVPTNGSDTNLSIIAGPFLNRITDHYYYLLGATNWATSETWAEEIGGHLATVRSADEENWIFDTFGDYQGKSRDLWIGLTNLNQGDYGFVDGYTNVAYTNWMFLQPTNCDGTRNYTLVFGPTNYLYSPTNSYPGLWALADNNGFVCGAPTATNIVYGVVEVTNLQTNGVQFWISVTNPAYSTNIIMTNSGCLFANLMDTTNGSHWIYSMSNLVVSNVFQYVALTYDTNSGIANLYYNGTNVASTNIGYIIPKTTGDVLLGKDMGLETNNYYSGEMDEMSIYGRALSDAEIMAIYHVSAYTTNRLIGKFDPTITPPESLAEAQVVLGGMTNVILGANNTWQEGSFSFTSQTNLLPMQVVGIEPGILLDDFSVSEAPLGNLYYMPEQPLDELKGENANGNWTLEIWNTRNNALATNALLLSWQLQMILITNTLPPVSLGSQEPTAVTIPPGQTISLAINAPSWATVATNTLISSTLPLNVFFNQKQPVGESPLQDIFMYSGTAGSEALTSSPFISAPTNFIPGQTYYIGLQNPGASEASAVFEVDFNILGLTNDVPYNDTLTNSQLRYYSFTVSSNDAYEATFQLLRQTGNADLVVSKGVLPTLTDSDYGSFNAGRADENIYVLTNSSPVPLTPGIWYLGVFNRGTNTVNYSVVAQELDLPPDSTTNNVTYIPLTNGVALDYTAGPGAALTNFFTFSITNPPVLSNGIPVIGTNGVPLTNFIGSIHFELYNLTGNGDLTVQTNGAPFAPPFFQSSQQPGLLPEFIQIQTNSALTNLAMTWYLGVPNDTTNLIHYTIIAVIDTNNVFPAFPGAEGAGAGAEGASIRNGFTNNTVYHVINLNDSGPGSLRDAVSSTNRTVIFDVSGVIYLQLPLVISNSYLSILGQTAPEGDITIADAPMIVSTNAHDVVIRYLRFRPNYAVPQQNFFVSQWFLSGWVNEFTPSAVQSQFGPDLNDQPEALVYDSATNLYIAGSADGNIYKMTPAGTVTTFASGMGDVSGLAMDAYGNLFASDVDVNNIYKFTPAGARSTFATGLGHPTALAFDKAGLLYETDQNSGNIYRFLPTGVKTVFTSGISQPFDMTFSPGGNLFVGTASGPIIEITPGGVQSTFATIAGGMNGLAFNYMGDMFVAHQPLITRITPTGQQSTFSSSSQLGNPTGDIFGPALSGQAIAEGGGDALQFNTVSNVIADHISAMWSSNNDLSVLNSTNVTVQWSIISDSIVGTNMPPPNGALVRFGSGPVSLHHNLMADNYTGSPHLGDNVALDFVNNVVYDWVTNAGYATNDIVANPNGYTNYLNYIANYVIASPAAMQTNIAFWSETTNTWVFQTNNFIDSDHFNGVLNGANTLWNMFTNWPDYNGLQTQTNQFRLPPITVDEAYLAYEKVLDFAGVSMFRREPAETNIVENVRRQTGSILTFPGSLPTNNSTVIYVNTSGDGIPDFWKTTFGQPITNSYNNFAPDNSGYSELEEFDNWLAGPHALTMTNTPIGVNLQKLFGKTGNLSFWLTNSVNGSVYLTNVLDSYTNQGQFSNSIAMFYPTNESGTNYSGFASFDVYVTNNDTVASYGPVTVSVFVGADSPTYSQIVGVLLPDPVTNNIGANTIQWYEVFVPTNAVAATNTLLFAGEDLNVWYTTNYYPNVNSPGAAELLTAVTNGIALIGTNTTPVLVPGGIYYLGVQNTNNVATTYAVGLDFDYVGTVPLTGGQPVTNTVPAGQVDYYTILVPTNAIGATNIIDFDNGPLNLWFNQTTLPVLSAPPDTELLAGFGPSATPGIGSPILTLSSSPPLVPGSTYYLAVDNTGGGSAVTYAIEVDFEYPPPVLPVISNIVVDAGSTLTVTNTATDVNPGTLFYSLTTLPPVGATINNFGIISWVVPANEPGTNILFTTIVTNSFTTLSATNSFTVTVIPESNSGPQTNTVPTNTVNWIVVNVPTNAIWATNILLFATNFPVNVLFTTNFPPSTNGAYTLMFDETNGTSVLGLNTAPTNIIPGGVYYIGIQNTNGVPVTYGFEVNFDLSFALAPPLSETLPASMVTGTSAQLNGFATPNASPAYVWFDLGVSTNYFKTTPQLSVGGGNNLVFVTNSISELLTNRVYHYRLDVSNALGVAYGQDQVFGVGGVAAWGDNSSGVTNVPLDLTNEIAIASEMEDGVALNNQGQVTVWGDDTFGQTSVPASLTNVTSIAAGNGSYALALQNGVVTGWGDDSSGQLNVPAGLSNVVEIAAGEFHGLALQNDGTVVSWGANGYGQTSVPASLSNVVSIAAGSVNSLALLNNHTVVAWGGGQSNTGTFPNYGQSIVPAGLTNVVAIASYGYTSMALKSDGTVVAWGYNFWGQTNVPGGLNNVVGIASGLYHSLAVQETGLAVSWGNDVFGETNVPDDLTNIYAVSGGNYFSMALESPLSINLNVTLITGGPPQTNSVAANSVVYYKVLVPVNAVAATNLLSFTTQPLNIWFNSTNLPQPANPPDTLLLASTLAPASAVLTTNSTPPLQPGGSYYLAIQNTGSSSAVFHFGVNFDLVQLPPPPATNIVVNIVHTNIGGTNGFLLEWYAPTNDTFEVQESPSLQPVMWNTFSNIVTYTGPPTVTNGIGLFTFFDNGVQYPFVSPIRIYQVLLLSSTPIATPITGGTPQTNTIPADSVVYYSVSVPANAIQATNLLSSATLPLNIWLNETNLPQPANPPDTLLLGGSVSGAYTLITNGAPPLVPGQTYYLAIQNNNNAAVSYVFGVNFNLVAASPPTPVFISDVIYTNISGKNGFLLEWYAPTNDTFEVQESSSIQPVAWQTFSNIVTYTGPLAPATNGLFTFFDNGSQYPFVGPIRIYEVLLLPSGGGGGSLVLPAQSNYLANTSQLLTVMNKGTDSNPSATLTYSFTNFPSTAPAPAPVMNNGVITWTPASTNASGEYKFTTVVTDNGTPPLSATNAFTVFVMPPPSIQSTIVSSTNVTFHWTAPTNDLFQVEWTTNLVGSIVWHTLPPTITSLTTAFTFTDTNAPVAMKFYRLDWLPLP